MMNYDILVIAGTADSRAVIEEELAKKHSVLACVATELGAEMLKQYPVDVHMGRLDLDGFVSLILDKGIGKVMDASHPFAQSVTETVQEACRITGVPYERLKRDHIDYDYDNILIVNDVEEAIESLNKIEGNVFLTTGVNTAGAYYSAVEDSEKRLFIRVLDNQASYDGCRKAGFPDDHVYGEMPPFTVEDNLRLIRETGAAVLVSKDSGKTGGVDVKVKACKEAGIPMVLIRRPEEVAADKNAVKNTKKKKDKMCRIPRLLIGGMNSGCGKTSITCGILHALVKRGQCVQSYKCGPDYIDPMLHSHITGRSCRNLDPFFSREEDLRKLVSKDSRDADITVIEGVMGYYDGIGVSCEKSTWSLSKATQTPTILIINVKGMSHTMIPLIRGMLEYRKTPVRGVILNRCSKGLFQMMKPEIEKELGIKAVGYFPYKEGVSIGSRHLGLMTAEEIGNLDEVLSLLGETAEECIDLDLLMEIAGEAEPLEAVDVPEIPREKRARIAVAKDKAFCFYYQENLDILEQLGAELVYFSPVNDDRLPENVDGIYLGGGYPETYNQELSENLTMKDSIRTAVQEGKPIFAECGGFMYTCRNLWDTEGGSLPMLGLVPTDVRMTKRLSMEFGYVTLTALEDDAFFKKGEEVRVHEFHYSRADQRGEAARMTKTTGRSWTGVYVKGHTLSGYPHFYFHNCRQVADRFVTLAQASREQKTI